MKKNLTLAAAAILLCGTAALGYSMCDTTKEKPVTQNTKAVKGKQKKVLVAYFSVPETDGVDASSGASRVRQNGQVMGNTSYVASIISRATGGDLHEIKTKRTYPGAHKALIDAAKVEHDRNARPKLTSHIKNLKDYDVIFVGFPNWWYDMPMPIYTFFDEYDFTGKTLIPFCTHGGSGFSSAISTIQRLEKGAHILDHYSIDRDHVAESKDDVEKWLKKIGM